MIVKSYQRWSKSTSSEFEYKRFTLTQEPNESQSICSSIMKELTGDDSINTRKLYSGNCSIK